MHWQIFTGNTDQLLPHENVFDMAVIAHTVAIQTVTCDTLCTMSWDVYGYKPGKYVHICIYNEK